MWICLGFFYDFSPDTTAGRKRFGYVWGIRKKEIDVVCNAGPCWDALLAFVAFAEVNQPTLVDEPSTLTYTLIQYCCTVLCAMTMMKATLLLLLSNSSCSNVLEMRKPID